MLISFIPTVLIPAQQWARRSRKRGGSVACTEQGKTTGIIRSERFVRVSRIWSGYLPEDEIQWGRTANRCHTMIKVASQSMLRSRFPFEAINWIGTSQMMGPKESKVDLSTTSKTSLHSVNVGSPKQESFLHGDGVLIVLKGLPVMGKAIRLVGFEDINKLTAMLTKHVSTRGEGEQFVFSVIQHERRTASAVR